uniref:Major facilitator superfamily (MFS) profile domain-containing protein n=1 Tax=Parascaris equorum TaxID=6256 RepID=A0A914R1W9_PAREQ
MADAMEMTLLAIISPTLQCEWNISSMEQAMITTVVFSGMMLSSTFWGNICDRFGRKMVFFSFLFIFQIFPIFILIYEKSSLKELLTRVFFLAI